MIQALHKPASISVVIPCYRQARFLDACIASLQAQTYPHWEAIIVDDGSPDETRDVAQRLMAGDPRVRFVQQSNAGPSSARNLGLSLARGDWIQFLDGDDLLMPTKFERQLAVLRTAPRLALSYTDYWRGVEDDPFRRVSGKRMPCRFTSGDPLFELARDWETAFSIPIHAPLVDAAFFRQMGIRFDETLRNHEDWDVWMRVFGQASEIHFIADELAIYRTSAGSNSLNKEQNWRGFRDAIDAQMHHYQHRADVIALLRHKRRETDWAYGVCWKRRLYDGLQCNSAYRGRVPWLIQQSVTSLLSPRKLPWPPLLANRPTVVRESGGSSGL